LHPNDPRHQRARPFNPPQNNKPSTSPSYLSRNPNIDNGKSNSIHGNNAKNPYLHPNDPRKKQQAQFVPSQSNPAASSSNVPSELRNFFNQLNATINTDQLDRFIENYSVQWLKCWQIESIGEAECMRLITSFARLPFSSKTQPPPLACCSRVLKTAISQCPPDDKTQRVDTIINFIQRMLRFEWDEATEDVRAAINDVLNEVTNSLDFKISEQKRLLTKTIALSDELEKPWSIQTKAVARPKNADLIASADRTDENGSTDWMYPTLLWLTDPKKFCPALLPKMCVPGRDSSGVYESVEEYFDIVKRLWTAITFSDGSNIFNPSCRWRDKDKECGHVLWPLTKIRIKCSNGNCPNSAFIACCNQNHPYGLCANCSSKIKNGLKGPPGPQACTHVYDGVVSHADWEDRLLISEFESR
jgi:hypothetical protein